MWRARSGPLKSLLLASAVLITGALCPVLVHGRQPVVIDATPPLAVAALPPQAQQTLLRIERGGPFPYGKDGSVFGNRERILPPRQRGYYLEYTVKTPGARNRGARRIVCGGQPRSPDVCFYTGDHYASFSRIAR